MDVTYQHFKMENVNCVLKLMEKDFHGIYRFTRCILFCQYPQTASKVAYRFIWNGQLFQFTCLPNGLTSAPRWFTKLLKPIFSKLRNQDYFCVLLDDIWLMGKSSDECNSNVLATCKLLIDAGFLINEGNR